MLGFIDRAAVVVHAGMGSNHRRSKKKEGKAKVQTYHLEVQTYHYVKKCKPTIIYKSTNLPLCKEVQTSHYVMKYKPTIM